jgi:hypothetical protein
MELSFGIVASDIVLVVVLLYWKALAPIAADILAAQRRDKGGKREIAPDPSTGSGWHFRYDKI